MPSFAVRFQGDTERARAAVDLWFAKVDALNGAERILVARLRGSDGTNLHYMDEALQREYQEVADSLSPEALDQIDRLMDPEADAR